MVKRPLRNLTAASILAGATHGAIAQAPMPQTPTTKILAVGTFAPGTDMSQVQRILPTEVRETALLYLDGCWYRLFHANCAVEKVSLIDVKAGTGASEVSACAQS